MIWQLRSKFLIVLFSILWSSCQTTANKLDKSDDLLYTNDRKVGFEGEAIYKNSLLSLEASLDKLLHTTDKSLIPETFEVCLLEFHSVGFLMEYYDQEWYDLLNSAPIVKEDNSTPGAHLIMPHGFQVIAEYLKEDPIDYDQIYLEAQYIKQQVKYFTNFINTIVMDEQSVINALSIQLLRMETLTITDFANLGETLSKKIFKTQLQNIHQYLNHYIDDSLAAALPILLEQYDDKIDLINFLQPYKRIIIPLTSPFKGVSPVDRKAVNLYDPNFLEASYFSNYGIHTENQVQKIELGRKLFNDPLLSHNNSFSCATCHQEEKAFTDGLELSVSGIAGIHLKRNTPTLIHSAYQSKYMYDGRAGSLEEQMLHVFNNPKEFKSDVTAIVDRISMDSIYLKLFAANYDNMLPNAVNLHSVTDALATYVRSLTAHQTTFDKYMRCETESISLSALNGFNVFMGKAKCGTCHFAPTFSGLMPPFYQSSELENIGVPELDMDGNWIVASDFGRYDFYPNKSFEFFFKTPTLRNIALTAPYMHNGVFKDLEEVMEFYNNGGGVGHHLNYTNQSLPSDSLGLTEIEIKDIIEFMKALTDSSYVSY